MLMRDLPEDEVPILRLRVTFAIRLAERGHVRAGFAVLWTARERARERAEEREAERLPAGAFQAPELIRYYEIALDCYTLRYGMTLLQGRDERDG